MVAEARINGYTDKKIKLYTIISDRELYFRDNPPSASNIVVHCETEFTQVLLMARNIFRGFIWKVVDI